jgi:hypothetical protein
MRQATLLVQLDDGGLGIGPQLSRGGTKGVGRLQAMASLHQTAALTALADVDVELPVDGLARDLDLELLGDVGLVEGPAAVRAGVWQGRLVGLVDLVGGRRPTVSLGAVVLAGLTAGLLGLVLGLALGEGSGLALAGAGRRRFGGGGARSRLAGHGGVAEGLGIRHTRRGAGRSCAAPATEQGSA